jgi:uroporphyrinogen decarboxylase
VVDYCRHTLQVMMPGGGYCFAPTHALQDNSPTENVVAMYETAHTYGRY